MIFIFDIDGTLSNHAHRLHYITGETKDREGFRNAQGNDLPIWEVITVARALAKAGNIIVYSTGRMEKDREVTQAWLNKYRAPTGMLYMRKDGDHREGYVVKSETLDTILGMNSEPIGGAFEDRQQMADMYRARGIRVFQVAKGDY